MTRTVDELMVQMGPDTSDVRRRDRRVYVMADFLAAWAAWSLFYVTRNLREGKAVDATSLLQDANFWLSGLAIATGWVLAYAIFDQYRDIYRLSRLRTLLHTFGLSIIGVIVLFFAVLLDDAAGDVHDYYQNPITLCCLHFGLTATARMVLLTVASRKLKEGLVNFNTLIIGGSKAAVQLYKEINGAPKSLGYRFIGFVDSKANETPKLAKHLPLLGGAWRR